MYGSESTNRPNTLGYGSGNGGGYGYGSSGYGGYGRPTGYGGPTGGYGISGTLADGDEFGHGDPNFSDGGVSQHTGNLHAQKVRLGNLYLREKFTYMFPSFSVFK